MAQACASLPARPVADAAGRHLSASYGNLPLSFVANQGQSDEQVAFLSRGPGYVLFLTPGEAVLSLRAPSLRAASAVEHGASGQRAEANARAVAVVRMRLVGANTRPQLSGLDRLPGTSNYFIGNDPTRWQTNVANYAKVKYAGVYPGIDLVYYGNQRELEYDLVVAPGADPARIALAFEGVEKLSLDAQGNLLLQTSHGDLAQNKPVIYQDIGGKRQRVDGRYVLGANDRVGFAIASYDTTQPLVIDPVLSYSSYLGGNSNDVGHAIAVDGAGNTYVTGETLSMNFPGTSGSPIQSTKLGAANSPDVFVTKLNAAGSALVYSTYLGGSGGDIGYAIAVDSAGNAYVTGETDSGTPTPSSIPYPTTAGALQRVYKLGGDAFVTKLDAAGSALVYSTFLGGGGTERGYGIAADSFGSAYVTGHTNSDNASSGPTGGFPTAGPLQFNNGSPGSYDAFVTKFNPAGSALLYSTYLGGNGSEFSIYGGDIAVDSEGNAYVGGSTGSTNFPGATGTPGLGTYGGGVSDAFVAKLNAGGSGLFYSTYLGGTAYDAVHGVAVNAGGELFVTGYTDSTNFPVAAPIRCVTPPGGSPICTQLSPLQASKGTGEDAFVSRLNGNGNILVYSTYLGGNAGDRAYDVAVDSANNAYVAGWTASSNFPINAPVQSVNRGSGGDVFISAVNECGCYLVYSTYLGGSVGSETARGIALDSALSVYVTGDTNSTDFPTATPLQASRSGLIGTDAFVAKVTAVPTAANDSYTISFNTPLTVPAPGVLANDASNGASTMSASLASGPTSGTLTLNSDGSFAFTAAAGFSGTATFTYRANNFAGASAPATVTITVLSPVGPPTDLIVTSVVNSRVTVTWRAPVTGSAPTGYVIEGGVTPGDVLASVPTNSTATTYTFVAPTGAFFIRMHSLASGGRSAASNEVNLFVNVAARPSAPANLLALVNGSSLALAWTNTAAGGAPTEIVVDVTGSLNLSVGLPVSETFSVSNVQAGTYTLSLRARNNLGASASSNSVTLTFPGPCSGVPATPSNFVVAKNGSLVTASWELPVGGPAPTSYRLIVSGTFTADLALTQRTISGAVGAGAYTLSVIATNACGSGPATAPQTVTIP